MKKNNYFKAVKANAERGEIHIYGDIVSEGWRWDDDETSAVSFRDALNEMGSVQQIDLYINSGGGDVFEAAAIYNMLKRHKARKHVRIDGLAASAASVIAMAGDTVEMPENAMLMIHNAWTLAFGNHNDFRKQADDLEKINDSTVKQAYLSKNPDLDAETLARLMDEETWLTAAEAKEMGLADEVTSAVQVAASISDEQMARYKNTPSTLKEDEQEHQQEPENTPSAAFDEEKIREMIAAAVTEQLKNQQDEQKDEPAVKDNKVMRLFANL